jgi:DNA-binding NarL/FixJ family response regulator
MIRLLICEDQTLVRQGLVTMLGLEPEIEVVGEAANGLEAVEKVGELKPDVVLLDVRMPIMDGVEATRTITSQYPDTRVIILTTYDYEEYVFDGVKAGAMSYVLKDTAAPDLVDAIRRVYGGETFIQPAVASKILFEYARGSGSSKASASPEYEALNEREIAIIGLLAKGMSNREVADQLALAEGTVRNYVSNILSKLHAANRVQAINLARQHKII